jgi:hypothetical protein
MTSKFKKLKLTFDVLSHIVGRPCAKALLVGTSLASLKDGLDIFSEFFVALMVISAHLTDMYTLYYRG